MCFSILCIFRHPPEAAAAAAARTTTMDSSGLIIEEQNLMTEPKYRVYMSNIDKALKNFEYSSEWADLISALGKLNKVCKEVECNGILKIIVQIFSTKTNI